VNVWAEVMSTQPPPTWVHKLPPLRCLVGSPANTPAPGTHPPIRALAHWHERTQSPQMLGEGYLKTFWLYHATSATPWQEASMGQAPC